MLEQTLRFGWKRRLIQARHKCMRPSFRVAIVVFVVAILLSCLSSENVGTSAVRTFAAGQPEPARGQPVLTEMRNVDYHVDGTIVLRIRRLRGALLPTREGVPPAFDDPQSFSLRIDSAEIRIATSHLTELINRHVLNYPGSPVKDLTITAEGNRLKQKGVLKKGLPIPFSVTADVGVTPDGKIRLHPTSIKAAGIPMKGLMGMFGLELENLVRLRQDRGMKVEGKDFILDPGRILPPPETQGRVTAVEVRGDELVQVFGSPEGERAKRLLPRGRNDPNYMYYRGGILQFGKLTMTGTDLEIIDAHPSDVFDFSLARYNEHLVAGYSKNTPNHGLMVYMPDLRQLGKQAAGGLRPANHQRFARNRRPTNGRTAGE